jgi:hypothetical protein
MTVQPFVNTFFEKRLEQLFDLAQRVEAAFAAAGLDYRVVGGLATYLYVEEAEPDAGRLTKDIDIAVRREDLPAISKAVQTVGLEYRHVAPVDMLVQTGQPSARRAVHLVFTGEKVRPEYPAATPDMGPDRRIRGIRLVPLEHLIRMKLTSFRLKDQAHLKDLEEAGLLTAEMEADLPEILLDRLAQIRAHE